MDVVARRSSCGGCMRENDEAVRNFLRLVGTGQIDEVQRILAASPQMVNAVGPVSFWFSEQMSLLVRPERGVDITAIRAVNQAAFETSTEADLVDALREHAAPVISSVADVEGSVVGHIMFSPVMLMGMKS